MTIPDQSKYPDISKQGMQSPMLSNLPFDHQAWIHPMQSYIWMHDIAGACADIMGIDMPEVQVKRFELLNIARFMEDHSGRSTGKTINYLMDNAVRSICINLTDSVWLGQEASIGEEIYDKHYGTWIDYEPNFRRFVTGRGNHKPQVSRKASGANIKYHNGSRSRTLSPDPRRDYKKMQSWRFNHGIFNEWTSWPYIHEIPDKVEPIFTNTNRTYRRTRQFRQSIEKSLGVELGYLTNEDLRDLYKEPGYRPRSHMNEDDVEPWSEALKTFYKNFEIAFGFDYRDGVRHKKIQFDTIITPNDIVMFFRNWGEGDIAYINKLIYDGSAKKPSDDCYWMHKEFIKKIKNGNRLYVTYQIGVDDIPHEWADIIYEPIIVEKARKDLLAEDFKRIWIGLWTEGRAKNPFAWAEVMGACEPGWLGQLARSYDGEIFIGAVDSAQGTDATYKTLEGVKDGRGDDGVDVMWLLGEGTAEKPHKLCLVHIAEDIRSEPMAYDVQEIEQRFQAGFYMIDPGGGGKGTISALAKKRLEKTDIDGQHCAIDVVPMLPWDHESPGTSKTNICIFSLSNQMITSAYIDAQTKKSLLQYSDQLNNHMVVLFQNALKDRAAILPQHFETVELINEYNEGKIDDDQFENLTDIHTALSQLVHLRYETLRSGKRKKTSRGIFTYTAPGNKDAAWTILMGYMMCDVIIQLRKLQEEGDDNDSNIPDVE